MGHSERYGIGRLGQEPSDVAFSPDGRTLASCDGSHVICLWDVTKGRVRTTIEGQAAGVYQLAFSPDGKLLASTTVGVDRAGEVWLWDMASGKVRAQLK